MRGLLELNASGTIVSKNNNEIQEQPLLIFAKFVTLVCFIVKLPIS